MKKAIALLLCLALATGLVPALAETGTDVVDVPEVFDTSFFSQNPGTFTIDIPESSTDTAYITINNSNEARSFGHPYVSEKYYSIVFPELMVMDYSEETNRMPFLRIWFRYRGTKRLNINAVTFMSDTGEYRFTDVTEPDWIATKEDGTEAQDLMIFAGKREDTAYFFAYLLDASAQYYVQKCSTEDKSSVPAPAWKVVLHGDEDITVTLPEGFWTDMGIFALSLNKINGFSYILKNDGSPCEFTAIK